MEYIRKQFYTLKNRILEPRKFMQVLAGPKRSFVVGTGGVSLEDFLSSEVEEVI